MKIRILCVGKIKENYSRDAIGDYLKRISPYGQIEIVEVTDEPITGDGDAIQQKVKLCEGNKLLEKIKERDFVVLLNLHQKQFDSVEFAKTIEKLQIKGVSTIDFIIGGSLGLGENIIKRADMQMSLSEMTFTHQMTRIIILEQIYRAFKILNNETYHK